MQQEPTRPGRPAPAELRAAAVAAEDAATTLARAVGECVGAGIPVDDEIYAIAATLTSWASWLGERAAMRRPE